MSIRIVANTMLTRRRALAGIAGMAAGAGFPVLAAPAPGAVPVDALRTKRLIVLSLVGGNDGLNTVVPVADPLYRKLRPTVGLPERKVLPLDAMLALHPALTSTMQMFQRGELAIVQDVGYPRPDLSHFVSAAIWESADPQRGLSAESGWWGEVVMQNRAAFDAAAFDAAAVTFESSGAFAAGRGVPLMRARQDVSALLAAPQAASIDARALTGEESRALGDMVAARTDAQARFARRLKHVQPPHWRPYEEAIDVQIQLTDWFLTNGVTTPLIRMTLGGFDTHSELLARHGALMAVLDRTLEDLRRRLCAAGLWDDTVVLVHSEFGRRPAENGHGGTDHGTAGPVWLLGGRVQGGIHGPRASLENLDAAGNPVFCTDFRRVYATVATGLFGLSVNPFADRGHAPLPVRLV